MVTIDQIHAISVSVMPHLQAHPLLTSRESVTLTESSSNSIPALRCANCGELVYAVEKAAAPGPARSLGFFSSSSSVPETPTKEKSRTDERSRDPSVKPVDGFVWIMQSCIDAEGVKRAQMHEHYSPVFQVIVDLSRRQSNGASVTSASLSQDSNVRQGVGSSRRSSFGQLPGAGYYTLPAVPSRLLTSPPQSPEPKSSLALLSAPLTRHPLAAQLESVALERLREHRAKAEAEIFELVRRKRKEMEALEQRTLAEGEVLLESTRSSSLGNRAASSGSVETSPLRGSLSNSAGRSRDASISALGRQSAVIGDRSASQATLNASISTPIPGSAFEKRVPSGPVPGSMPNVSSSLSALSASFAMRGQQNPEVAKWANARRRREGHPDGDDSALNTEDEDDSERASDSNDEMESRGRGRERHGSSGEKAPSSRSAERQLSSTPAISIATGTPVEPKGLASGSRGFSLPNKSAPTITVNRGMGDMPSIPRANDRLDSSSRSQQTSKEGARRPRSPPPSGTEPLKPATRSQRGKTVQRTENEKKVAFAETTEKVEGHLIEESDEEPRELVDEGDGEFVKCRLELICLHWLT